MKQYFYALGSEQQGPFSFEEMKSKNITAQTQIWFDGLANWTPAQEIAEFAVILNPPMAPVAPAMSNDVTTNSFASNAMQSSTTSSAALGNDFNTNSFSTNTSESTTRDYSGEPQKMFARPFSLKGRIRRLEFGLTYIVYMFAAMILGAMGGAVGSFTSSEVAGAIFILGFIPLLWFVFAQGVKRCHDRNASGFFMLIPFYGFWMLFAESNLGDNNYGPNPKGENFNSF